MSQRTVGTHPPPVGRTAPGRRLLALVVAVLLLAVVWPQVGTSAPV